MSGRNGCEWAARRCGECGHWALLWDAGAEEAGVCLAAMRDELGGAPELEAAAEWVYWHGAGAGTPACDGFEEV